MRVRMQCAHEVADPSLANFLFPGHSKSPRDSPRRRVNSCTYMGNRPAGMTSLTKVDLIIKLTRRKERRRRRRRKERIIGRSRSHLNHPLGRAREAGPAYWTKSYDRRMKNKAIFGERRKRSFLGCKRGRVSSGAGWC